MAESAGARIARWTVHFFSHPVAWGRYLWIRELRHREVRFLTNPRFLDYRPMWRVSRRPLSEALSIPVAELDPLFEELGELHRTLSKEAGAFPSAGALMQAPILYVLVRRLKPRWVVETGISSGYSARLILEAMERNGHGHLDSIGIDVFGIVKERFDDPNALAGRALGWLVPERLKDHWSLRVGKSTEHLPKLLSERTGPLDLFLHDSLHNYETMHWEYAQAWPRIPSGGVLASHDVHNNAAWPDFLREQGASGLGRELDHDLGIVRKPGPTGTSPRPASG